MSNEIKEIEKILDAADVAYYTFGQSELSDSDYDSYKDRLRLIDPKNKRFKQVGAKEDDKSPWQKFSHAPFFMGSLNKVNIQSEFNSWFRKYNDDMVIQEKLDGISIKMIYKNGKLTHAVTRGDGQNGEDILRNVLKMKGVPQTISNQNEVIVRGEIVLYKSKFDKIGAKTLRNGAAGTSKRHDGKGCEYLNVKTYDIMNWKSLGISTNKEIIKALKSLKFDVVNTYFVSQSKDVADLMDAYVQSARDGLDWEIDGLVIKLNTLKEDEWAHPERAIAYKFPNKEALTKLIDVEWNDTGGRICPVGILEPIKVEGVEIGRATLNNIDHIKTLGIKIGDTVRITRRNDVIPCIEEVKISNPNGKAIVPPTHDDEGYPIVREKNAEGKELVYLVSTNPNSKSRKLREILSWFSAHDVKGLAEATIQNIIDADIAKSLPDFYDICLNGDTRLLNLDGFGQSKFKLLNKAALQTSKTTLLKFLDAIDISGFGTKKFEAILESVNKEVSVDDFIKLSKQTDLISKIQGFGNNTALSLKEAIERKSDLIKEMVKRVEVQSWKPGKVNTNSSICGKSFCFTGAMNQPREVYEKMVKDNGGIVSSSVSKNLNYLVTNEPNSGSSKNQKADSYGIPKIDEQKFLKLLNG